MDPCTKAVEIDHIRDRLEKIEETIDGNGKPGMKADLISIRDSQQFMAQTLAALSTNVSALLIFQAEMKTVERVKLNTRDIVNMIITGVLSAAAVAVAIIVS
ncbi:MAG TPA: hypothetical protein PKJ08_12500 [Candidatus Cloacimonadota bacterium]|nr:hypothetical protein [Candidatus Cloacimonadota bacterium]